MHVCRTRALCGTACSGAQFVVTGGQGGGSCAPRVLSRLERDDSQGGKAMLPVHHAARRLTHLYTITGQLDLLLCGFPCPSLRLIPTQAHALRLDSSKCLVPREAVVSVASGLFALAAELATQRVVWLSFFRLLPSRHAWCGLWSGARVLVGGAFPCSPCCRIICKRQDVPRRSNHHRNMHESEKKKRSGRQLNKSRAASVLLLGSREEEVKGSSP